MIFQSLNRNSITAFVLLPLFLLGFWLNSFVGVQSGSFPFSETPMPLFGLLLGALKGNHFLSTLISMLIALVMMLGVNRMVNRFGLSNNQTAMPGYLYLFLVSGYLMAQQLHPVWFFTPLLLLSIERLFSGGPQRKPMAWCFESAFWLSVGSLFYAKGIYFIIMIWMIMFILRMFTFRSILASLIGFVLPYIFAFGYFFLVGRFAWFADVALENFISPIAFFSHTIFSQLYNGIIIFLVFLAILAVVRIMPMVKIITRKYFRIFIWLIVLGIVAALTPYYSLEVVPILAIGASIILSRFLNAIRKPVIQEVVFVLLFIMTLAAQFLI
nr:hypothetical protein [uncultured Carboxylicivirga sp.]